MNRQFFVIDKTTGQAPDMEKIALREKWADGLIYCDMEGFAVGGDGSLYLLDECGAYRSCPDDRFEIVWANTNIKANAAAMRLSPECQRRNPEGKQSHAHRREKRSDE